MSGIFGGGDNEAEAWDDLLFGRGEDQEDQNSHRRDTYRYRNLGPMRNPFDDQPKPRVRYDGVEERFNIMTMEPVDNPQPEFHLMRVSALYRETQLAYLVTGTIEFDPPFRGVKVTELHEVWIPKSRCLVTGDAAQIPHWLLKRKMDYPNVIGRAPQVNVDLSALKSQAIHVQKLGRAYRGEVEGRRVHADRYKHLKGPF